MPLLKIWRFTLLLISLFLLASCTSMSTSSSFKLEENLKDSWRKESGLLKKIDGAQDKNSINLLQREVKKIEEGLIKTERLLKKVAKEENLSKAKIKKYQESFFLLSEVAGEVESFLNFQLSSEEESKILADLSWRLTLLSGKLAGSFNWISIGKFEEAKRGIEQAKAELNACRELIDRVRERVSLGLEEVTNHLDKLGFLIGTAESLTNKRELTKEEKEKIAKAIDETLAPSLDVLSLNELSRDVLVKQASLKLEEVARNLNIR